MERITKKLAAAGVTAALAMGFGGLVGCDEGDPLTEAENTIEGTAHDEHDGHDHSHGALGAAEQLQNAAGEAQQKVEDAAE